MKGRVQKMVSLASLSSWLWTWSPSPGPAIPDFIMKPSGPNYNKVGFLHHYYLEECLKRWSLTRFRRRGILVHPMLVVRKIWGLQGCWVWMDKGQAGNHNMLNSEQISSRATEDKTPGFIRHSTLFGKWLSTEAPNKFSFHFKNLYFNPS